MKLLLPFLTDDRYFCLGFEAGMLFQKMLERIPVISGPYHEENADQLFLIASRLGYAIDWHELGEGWIYCTFMLKEKENVALEGDTR